MDRARSEGRPTMDIDLLGLTSNDVKAIERQVRDVLREPVEEDGLEFDVESVEAQRIVDGAPYHGVRVRCTAHLAVARVRLQIDIGFGDPVHPSAVEEDFPTLLEFPAPRLLCYSRESAVAERFEAMVRHGELNSRMKDFYDVWLLSRSFAFDGPTLSGAIRRTFASRETGIDANIAAFSDSFALARALQWRAFRRRGGVEHAPDEFDTVIRSVAAFLKPVAAVIAQRDEAPGAWTPPGRGLDGFGLHPRAWRLRVRTARPIFRHLVSSGRWNSIAARAVFRDHNNVHIEMGTRAMSEIAEVGSAFGTIGGRSSGVGSIVSAAVRQGVALGFRPNPSIVRPIREAGNCHEEEHR